MPSNEEDQKIYGEEDLEEEESEEEEDDDDEEEEEDLNFASPSTSSSSQETSKKDSSTNAVAQNPTAASLAVAVAVPTVTAAPIETPPAPDNKRQRTVETSAAAEEKKPSAFDESRRLFQRLWTDEDEIGLLQGFLDFSTQRGTQNSSHHHDTGPFYDQIKTRLQLDFNKNQLVEKLRRLKKKYRNVVSRISSGKEFSFKSPHDQAAFEISRKIWSNVSGGGGGVEETRLEEDEGNLQNINISINNNDNDNYNNGIDVGNSEKKVPSSRRRSRKRPAEGNLTNHQATPSIPNVVEDTVRSCLSPMFKELLYCAIKGPCNTGGYGGITMNLLPLNFGGNSMNFSTEVVDEKWRKQQILELEVYSKRIELVQDQIKSALEELRSMGR
ncbi:hypothetical protein HHK36_023096 [Tetracentron sinense]|uniref:Glabrous enhancer-binding protein-like DBD domain-containing protein n=1 Tax=Tetracentron sinense TaxID=13715 RepID=A0A835D9G9_TETSI|nr:hypothetical protein HHK36_023096 [Tetracentron sinense]